MHQWIGSADQIGHVAVRADSLFRIHVDVGPRGVVSPDGHQRDVERTVVGTDVFEARAVAGVAAEITRDALGLSGPRTTTASCCAP